MQYVYADDLGLMSTKDWHKVKKTLITDLNLISDYLKTWRQKLSLAKTTSTPFHLYNKEADRQLQISLNGKPIRHNPFPTYLVVTLDRQFTFKKHCENICAKALARNNLIRCLTGNTWRAKASMRTTHK